MARLIRWHLDEFVHFVTNRTQHKMYFLLPTQKVNELILFWLSKAKAKKGKHIELYAFIFLSNHFHMILRDPEGELAEFMGYFQGNLAKAVNKVIKRDGSFWEREYDDVIVDGEKEFLHTYSYIICNPVKAGLVAMPKMWKGISSLSYAQQGTPVVGKGINVTNYNNATRFGRKADKKKFEETHSFDLAVPPMMEGQSVEKRTNYLDTIVNDASCKYRKARGAKPSLGMEKVLAQSPFDRPKSPARGARFKIMSFCKARKKELENMYKNFVLAYKEAVQQLIIYFESAPIGQNEEADKHYFDYLERAPAIFWPPGCYLPTRHKPTPS